MVALFEKYGKKYNFDPLMLTAQGYQESQLNQKARSQGGAIGVMQVMPAIGKEMKVGDIRIIEPNIQAGTKYMDQLMSKFFPDNKFDADNRTFFAFASYNAGPGNISKMRKEAANRDLDPDKWFNNVEIVTARKVGIQTDDLLVPGGIFQLDGNREGIDPLLRHDHPPPMVNPPILSIRQFLKHCQPTNPF